MKARFERVQAEGVPVLVVHGKLGIESLEGFQDALGSLVGEDSPWIILDLMGCPYMSSRTFPPLLHRTEELRQAGRLFLVACGDELLEILQILRLDQRLNLHPTRDQCVRAARVDAAR